MSGPSRARVDCSGSAPHLEELSELAAKVFDAADARDAAVVVEQGRFDDELEDVLERLHARGDELLVLALVAAEEGRARAREVDVRLARVERL